jgi:glycosyltransferase involved in cell wall biosynthesis
VNVLHVIPSLGPLRGGPSFALPPVARALAQAGVHVVIATTDDNGHEHLPVVLNRPVVDCNVTRWYFRRQTRIYTFSWPLTNWLARHIRDYDLLHIHALFSYPSIIAAFWARHYKVPYIMRPLGTLSRWGMQYRRPWLKKASFRLVERRALTGAAVIHYTSEQEKEEARSLHVRTRTVVLPLGVDTDAFRHLPGPGRFLRQYPHLEGRKLVLFLSRLDPKKGLDILLSAFRLVHKSYPEAVLVIAGDGEARYIDHLRNGAGSAEIGEHVTWVGFLSGNDKLSALSAASLFVLPSYSENFGIAVIEAMAAGLPVVISDRVGICHEVKQHQAGIVVSCEALPLASAMKELMSNSNLQRQMGSNGRALVKGHFSTEGVTHKLLALYNRLLREAK